MKNQELIDIIDEDGKDLGIVKEKLQAHRDKDWHRTTQIWIINKKSQILINKRSTKQFQDPDKWASFFGGHLLAGEAYLEGAVRELNEELGLKLPSVRFKRVELRKNAGANEVVQVYIVSIENDDWLKGESTEVTECQLVSFKDLIKLINKNPDDFSGGADYVIKQITLIKSLYETLY